jgi:hypothetical protein
VTKANLPFLNEDPSPVKDFMDEIVGTMDIRYLQGIGTKDYQQADITWRGHAFNLMVFPVAEPADEMTARIEAETIEMAENMRLASRLIP